MPWKTKHSSNAPGPLFFKFLNETSLPVIAQCKVSEETCQMRLKCLRYIHIKFLKIQTSNITVGEQLIINLIFNINCRHKEALLHRSETNRRRVQF